MAKIFSNISFDHKRFEAELSDFAKLLKANDELDEKAQIQPFFKSHQQLSSQIALLFPEIVEQDKIAFEFDLWGDFKCDLVIGDGKRGRFCLVEFEDATEQSIFEQSGTKYNSEFGNRFEHGYSQIVDWFYKLKTQSDHEIKKRFGKTGITYQGVLLIGRDKFLSPDESERLDWRIRYTRVDSRAIYCMTFDELYRTLQDKLTYIKKAASLK